MSVPSLKVSLVRFGRSHFSFSQLEDAWHLHDTGSQKSSNARLSPLDLRASSFFCTNTGSQLFADLSSQDFDLHFVDLKVTIIF